MPEVKKKERKDTARCCLLFGLEMSRIKSGVKLTIVTLHVITFSLFILYVQSSHLFTQEQ